MENIIRIIPLNPAFSFRARLFLTYFSLILFIALVGLASIAVKDFVSNSLSVSFIESDSIAQNVVEEAVEENSITLEIKKGDTLKAILYNQNIPKDEIFQIIKIAEDHKITSSLKIGQQIIFDYEYKILENDNQDLVEETRILNKITFIIDKINSLEISREGNNFIAKNSTIPLTKSIIKSSAVINTSFMSALKSLGLSTNSIIELINSYSYQIDFQRQIQPGDTISVITEKFTTSEGKFSHYGRVISASLNLSGEKYNIYRYSPNNSDLNLSFFSENGKSVKRSLLRTPVNLIRISSHYGNRLHPTLGFTKMHRGVDFAAPIGTPIYAAGDGVVTEIGSRASYGKIIQIKHSSTLTTAYAHASKFAKNLKLGDRVKQGQIIAYVGKTGRTTGAHLHYEVKIDGKHVNPMSIKTTPGIELTGAQLANFRQFKNKIIKLSNKLDNAIEVAENEILFD